MTSVEAGPAYPIESVRNALLLLLQLRDRPVLRVSECAAELGVARSTAHRLLTMLEHYGFVRRDPASRSYRAGDALLSIGLAAISTLDIRDRARPFLHTLRDQLGETVSLVLLEGSDARFVDAAEATRALRVGGLVGLRLPAHATSAGKALLADLPAEQLAALYPDELLPASPDGSQMTRTELEMALAEVRESGYAVAYNESDVEIGAVGVSIPVGPDHVRAALAIAAPASRLTPERVEQWARAAHDTAQRIGMR
ncbi:IclR family transcriptional regulator [Petropleomorpha daqingensis]|uniref:DNA-binding IclR family transcriptional regulator n=1 Tax=Petropleomorpha daqingensis TaxID=2026353 RepID=A0A853C9R5_9ACTN|nr:IclR family transcriptional regulator [Petropleomorpha daqingensis]NYJ03901.1 DNA-binding IclR family transcriptional regulator [Petropleomorpha daqingensis]